MLRVVLIVLAITGQAFWAAAASGQDLRQNVVIPYLADQVASTPEDIASDSGGADTSGAQHSVRVLISAPRGARISSQMRGRIVSIPVRLGSTFNRGQRLVSFDCRHQEAKLASAQAGLSKAMSKLTSQLDLRELDASSQLDVDLAKADVEVARGEVDQAQAEAADCNIDAPYAGRVVRVQANEFEIVEPGAGLMEIVEAGKLRLEALVPSEWLVWLRPGVTFTVVVDEIGKEFTAIVSAVGSRVDPVSQTIPIEGEIKGSSSVLLPGMSGDAVFSPVGDSDE